MNEKITKLNNNLVIHTINTDKFKTNLIAAFMLVDLKKEDITLNALIPSVLRRGTVNLKTMKDISKKMDDMYGAIFDASSDKIGDKQAIQFYISTIDDEYALNNEKLLFESIDFLNELIFNPKLVDGKFDDEYVASEKEMLRELIKGKINDKSSYAMYRCIEEMFENDAYGIYKYGIEEDIDKITSENLYEQYKSVLENGEMHFYIVGKFDENEIIEYVNENIKFEGNNIAKEYKYEEKKELDIKVKNIKDEIDVVQGKIVLGYEALVNPSSDDYYKIMVYNAILGGSVNSKMFQNVREKESLAYTARSLYIKHKAILLITAGIEMQKYEKALEVIKIQEEDMKKGNFTAEDIVNAKIFLTNLYKSYTDDAGAMVDLSFGQYLLNMKFDVDEIIEKINNVNKEDIINIANKMKLKVNYFLGNKGE